ncbi:uncharacterized protein [Chironomus tepperi]|uniref:uncharacterized protein n=1 Tax=Chironomus tepperi TaxID=113505 RepID=UPI00391F918C
MRSSGNKNKNVIDQFKLYEYKLSDIAQAINSNFTISFKDANNNDCQFYEDLKKCSERFKRIKDDSIIGSKIKDLIKDSETSTRANVLTIKKKFYMSSELSTISINSNISEINLICDTLFIDSNLPTNFRGKNFAIYANYVKINGSFTWDLSGEKVIGNTSTNAGQDSDGRGIDGQDGKAGKSGGNFSLYCKKIYNSPALTIISNGSDGTDGHDGGNGKNGKDGKDATRDSFDRENFKGNMIAELLLKFFFTLYIYDYKEFESVNFQTKSGLSSMMYINNTYMRNCGFILVKGSSGTPGKSGGLGGFGGQGGHAGEIFIKSTDSISNIKEVTKKGLDGKSGVAGFDGMHGNEGRDAWVYFQRYCLSGPRFYGLEARYKYELTVTTKDREESVRTDSGNYIKPEIERRSYTYSSTVRNQSEKNRQRQYQATADKSSSINMNSIISKHSSYLSDLNLNIQHRTSSQIESRENEFSAFKLISDAGKINNESYFQLNFHKASNKCEIRKHNKTAFSKKSTILGEMTTAEYSDYLKTSNNHIEEIINKYKNVKMEIEQEETKVQTEINVQVKFEANRQKMFEKLVNIHEISYDKFKTILIKIIKKKLALLTFEDIYLDVIYNVKYPRSSDKIEFLEKEQIAFLTDTNDLLSSSVQLNQHFTSCNDKEKDEILSYFQSGCDDFNVNLLTAIYNILLSHQNELEEIKEILNKYADSDADSEDEDEFYDCNKNLKPDSIKMIFKDEKIRDFIKNDIRQRGTNSILYRCILAYMVDVKLTMMMKIPDQSFKIIEEHNYENNNSKKEIIIRKKGIKFTVLEVDMSKYEAYKANKIIESKFEDTLKSLLNDEDLHPPIREKSAEFNEFLRVFEDNNSNTVIDSILSKFPQTLLRYDDNGMTSFVFDDQIDENLTEFNKNTESDSNINPKYSIQDDEWIREDIKRDLLAIECLHGLSILKAIDLRFSVDSNSHNLYDFLFFLKNLLDLLLAEQSSVSKIITFMILGNDQHFWSFELSLLKLDNIYKILDGKTKQKWRCNAKQTEFYEIFDILLEKVSELENEDDKPDKDELDNIMTNLHYFDTESYDCLKKSTLLSWRLMTTEKYWTFEISKLEFSYKISNDLKVLFEDLHSIYGSIVKNVLIILQNKRKKLKNIDLIKFLRDFHTGKFKFNASSMDILRNKSPTKWTSKLKNLFCTEKNIRNTPEIVKLIQTDQETSSEIKEKIQGIGQQAQQVFTIISSLDNQKKVINLTESELKYWISEVTSKSFCPSVVESLAAIVRMFQLTTGKIIRDTQLISILTMWNNEKGVLMQVSTGEGKTFIGVAFAILKVLYGENIDIITSSSVLALRDVEENKKFFNFFGITVDHNGHNNTDMTKQAYECKVVYGVLGNFQRDYLLTEFFDGEFMTGHHFQNVLVDEVDSMLLDKGNNILYLSSNIPDIDELESIFIFIWQYVNQGSSDPEEAMYLLNTSIARKVILDNVYGILDEKDIQKMKPDIKNSNEIITKLKNSGIIDDECVLYNEPYDEHRFNATLKDFDDDLSNKIKFYCRNKMESKKTVKIPKYLNNFVRLHLDNWIDSAIRAMYLRNQSEYIVDTSLEGQKQYKEPNIIILDLDTGTDMSNSQWDEGLHQFLQLKHGCKLTLVSLKSVFISNVTFFKKYRMLYGMTGTLGNLEERIKTTEIHKIDFATLPRYREQKYQEYPSILIKDPNEWLQKITKEVIQRFNENRSVLIICETIHDTKAIKKALNENSSAIPNSDVYVYQRENEKFNIDEFKPKQVIVATNLASRGTDIKLSEELRESGGLHVILAYLPQNARIENQAYGRASRAGDMGSGRLIICTDKAQTNDISKLKETRNHNELQRLAEINSYYQNFITIEEDFFEKFHLAFKDLQLYGNKISENTEMSREFVNGYKGLNEAIGTDAIKIYLENFKLQWSFWLDENSKKLEQRMALKHDVKDIHAEIEKSFNKFISSEPEMHPVKQIELFKFFNNNKSFKKAVEALDIESNRDSIAFQYYKCYNIIKEHQIDNGYENRILQDDEEKELLKCLNMLTNRIQDRSIRVLIANSIKKNYKNSLITVNGYEHQQKLLNEIDEIFIDSIHSLLGRPITPEIFTTPDIKLDVIKKEIFDEMNKQNVLIKIKVNRHYSNDDLRQISLYNGMKFEELKHFLDSIKNIKSIDDFGDKLKKSIKMPSREEFWDDLVDKKILTDEVTYAIIDMNILQNVDPSIHEEIRDNFKNNKLSIKSSTELFLDDIEKVNDDESQFIIPLKSIESQLSPKRFNYLKDNDVIAFNKQSTFNIANYEKFKDEKIFNNFDDIKKEDFNLNNDKIIEILTATHENGKEILTKRGSTYALNFKNINMLELTAEESIFGENEVYQSEVFNIIATKFAYRIALENLYNKIIQKNDLQNSKINLILNPHKNVINDLIANNILILPKVDKQNISKIKDMKESLRCKYVTTNSELWTKYIGTTPHGSVFTKHKTIEFLNENFDKAINDFDSIVKRMIEWMQMLSNDNIEKPDIVLKPLEDFIDSKHHEMMELVHLKGFDMIIKIEFKKYSSTYWKRFTVVIILALIQIVVGAAIVVLSNGIFYKVGEMLIQEGISDAIFAIGTLRSGHFSWKDYGKHKLFSIITTISFTTLSIACSQIKYLKNYFRPNVNQVNNYLTKYLVNKPSVFQLLKSGKTETIKEVFKLFCKEVALNVGKAVTQASIGMGADYLIENYISQVTEKISKIIIDYIQKGYWNHEICDTIKNLLQHYSQSDLMEKILKEFNEISSQNQFWADIMVRISEKVDELIQTGHNISKLLTYPVSLISKIMELSFVSVFALKIFNYLNNKLKVILNEKNANTLNEIEVDEDDAKKFNQAVLDHIKAESTQKIKNTINSSIIKPFVTYAANAVVNKCKVSIKGLINERKEKKISKEANEIYNKNASKGELTKKDIEKANKVLARSKDPRIHALLIQLNIPLTYVAIKAIHYVLNNKFGEKYTIVIEHEGQKYSFNDGNAADGKIIELKLDNGHMENSKNSNGNNCVYDALADQIPHLRDSMSPIDLRESIGLVMLTNKDIQNEIKSSHKGYYMRIGFYCGAINKTKDDQNNLKVYVVGLGMLHNWGKKDEFITLTFAVGTYDAIKSLTENRKFIAEIDHFIPKAVLKNFKSYPNNSCIGYILKNYGSQLPCILLFYRMHRNLSTTGWKRECRNKQTKHLDNGSLPSCILESIVAYQNGITLDIENKKNDHFQFKIYDNIDVLTSDVKEAIHVYIDLLGSEIFGKEGEKKIALLTSRECDVLKGYVDRIDVNNPIRLTIDDFKAVGNFKIEKYGKSIGYTNELT